MIKKTWVLTEDKLLPSLSSFESGLELRNSAGSVGVKKKENSHMKEHVRTPVCDEISKTRNE